MRSVLQSWVTDQSLAIQGTLLCAVRGPDGQQKESPAKELTRAYRATILINAHEKGYPGDDFMGDYSGIPNPLNFMMGDFVENHDQYPHHWLLHIIHAAQIVGYCHPREDIKGYWSRFYVRMCAAMHMLPEPEDAMRHRLREKKLKETQQPAKASS